MKSQRMIPNIETRTAENMASAFCQGYGWLLASFFINNRKAQHE
jgi:hypothetical protein